MSHEERQQGARKQNSGWRMGGIRISFGRIFASGTKRSVVPTTKLAIEQLETRHLLAAQFFAPAEPAGSVNVQLVPLANVAAGTQEIVTFGVPFTRGSVSSVAVGSGARAEEWGGDSRVC